MTMITYWICEHGLEHIEGSKSDSANTQSLFKPNHAHLFHANHWELVGDLHE